MTINSTIDLLEICQTKLHKLAMETSDRATQASIHKTIKYIDEAMEEACYILEQDMIIDKVRVVPKRRSEDQHEKKGLLSLIRGESRS